MPDVCVETKKANGDNSLLVVSDSSGKQQSEMKGKVRGRFDDRTAHI